MKNKSIRWIFWAMVAVFVIIILSMFILVPILGRTTGDSPLRISFFVALPVFFVLGIALLVLTIRKQEPGLLKKFLLLTASSTVGLAVFAVLHNLVTALLIYSFHFAEDFDEPVFFTIATVVCPLGFLVGAIGTIILEHKNKSNVTAVTP
jgi:quinol-cytochrome oxidoreductase complex cytochrome b subunit